MKYLIPVKFHDILHFTD